VVCGINCWIAVCQRLIKMSFCFAPTRNNNILEQHSVIWRLPYNHRVYETCKKKSLKKKYNDIQSFPTVWYGNSNNTFNSIWLVAIGKPKILKKKTNTSLFILSEIIKNTFFRKCLKIYHCSDDFQQHKRTPKVMNKLRLKVLVVTNSTFCSGRPWCLYKDSFSVTNAGLTSLDHIFTIKRYWAFRRHKFKMCDYLTLIVS